MPTFSIDIDFEVYCSCGKGLCNNSTEGTNRHSRYITVEPCEDCLERSHEEGYNKGFDEGREE